jgi:nucleoside-diphosphate-sugar epimerase
MSSFSFVKPKFCVVGATSGTGLRIARQLLESGSILRVVARYPDKARRLLGTRVKISQGDVTDARSIRDALAADDKAIFFTVAATGGMDGRGLFASETMIRKVTYQGLLNVVDSARAIGFQGRIILPSVFGADRSSIMIGILNRVKRGLQQNLSERELYLRASGLNYTIVRAPILTNGPAGQADLCITGATHLLTAGPRLSRGDLARVLILVSEQTVASGKTFDLFRAKGVSPSDHQILDQLEQIATDVEMEAGA